MKRLVILLPAFLAFQVGVQPALAWTWPVDGPVLRQFEFGDDPYAGGQHRGIDIGATVGEPVLSPATGMVTFAGTVPGGGRSMTIETQDGYAVTLLHLGTLGVEKGAGVAEGAPVATGGTSGVPEHAEPYVHLGIRLATDPDGYLDPLLFLPARPAGGAEPVAASTPVGAVAPPVERTAPVPRVSRVVRPSTGAREVVTRPRALMGRTVAPEVTVVPVRHPLAGFSEPPVHARSGELAVQNERDSSRNWFSFAALAGGAAALGVLRRQLRDARMAHGTPAVFLQRLVGPAEDAERLGLRQKDGLVLDRDLQGILLSKPEALANLDGDHDPPQLVDLADDSRPRHSLSCRRGRHRSSPLRRVRHSRSPLVLHS
jgi:Peptidase family M23